MRWFTYDTEVFLHDFIVVFKDIKTGEYFEFHNDWKGVSRFFADHQDSMFCGFNTKNYDRYIIKGIVYGLSCEELKMLNDWIIVEQREGWQCPLLQGCYFKFNNVDLTDDMQKGQSLKSIEGHLGLNIKESSVDFNIDRPLTEEEIEESIIYCRADVDATETLTETRKDYLQNKINLGKVSGLDIAQALALTNAKLTAKYLKATRKEWDDERDYKYPDNLNKEYIQPEVLEFFDKIHDKSITNETYFESSYTFNIGECVVKIGFGGIHGAIPFYHFKVDGNRIILNYDVASYYPHLMVLYNYVSRNIPDPKEYAKMLRQRIEAKNSGDIVVANALKLVANTTYGAMLDKYNDLNDPLMGRSVCITGQLFLLELSNNLVKQCESLKIVQLNTDGIMIEIDKGEYDKVQEIIKEWETRTGFTMEEDKIKAIHQKDVNNYIEVADNGEYKIRGGYLVRGIAKAGAFKVNNNANIVAKSIVEYFVNSVNPEITIWNCDDITQYQIIAKAGSKYKESYHIVNGEKESVQKVNRVYATKDMSYGKLFKVKEENEQNAKIESLPDHCIIDNDNKLTIIDVDKSFYIDMAKKRINDFLGIKPEKPKRQKKGNKQMATSTTLNVYSKLIKARKLFLDEHISKSGKNMHLQFKYFELDDIVPIAIKIFEQVGLVPVVSFSNEHAEMVIMNTDNIEESVDFRVPLYKLEENKGTNVVQAFGATMTYYRRYLYMLALDICEPDTIDTDAPVVAKPVAPAVTKPVPAVAKAEPVATTPKVSLTKADGQASATQIKQLKEVLKKLKDSDKKYETYVATVATSTGGFVNVTKAQCEKYIVEAVEMLTGVNNG